MCHSQKAQTGSRLKVSHHCLNICLVAREAECSRVNTRLILFSVFSDDLDDDTECRNSRSEDDIKLELLTCQILTFVEGSSGTWDLTKQIKMYIVPHLGQSNAMHQERLGTTWLSSSPAREDLEVTGNVRTNGSQWCAYCQ